MLSYRIELQRGDNGTMLIACPELAAAPIERPIAGKSVSWKPGWRSWRMSAETMPPISIFQS